MENRLVLALPLLLLLVSCGDDAEVAAPDDDGREASGEILPSSISDDMIATDRLRSQPPLVREVPSTPSAGAPATESDVPAPEAAEPAAEAAPEPPAEPDAPVGE